MSNPFELYDEYFKPEMELFNEIDQEKINIEGAPMTVWLFDLDETKKQDDTIPDDGLDMNDLYGESPPENLVYEGPYGPIKGSYLEPTWTQDLTAFGITEPEEINIKFNKDQVVKLFGRGFIIGDILKTFHKKYYIIEDAYVSDETALWEFIHINVIARKVDVTNMSLPGVE